MGRVQGSLFHGFNAFKTQIIPPNRPNRSRIPKRPRRVRRLREGKAERDEQPSGIDTENGPVAGGESEGNVPAGDGNYSQVGSILEELRDMRSRYNKQIVHADI